MIAIYEAVGGIFGGALKELITEPPFAWPCLTAASVPGRNQLLA